MLNFDSILTNESVFVNEIYGKSAQIVKTVFSYIDREYGHQLTTDEQLAKLHDPEYEMANINDLHDWVAASGEVFDGILLIKEGLCKWFERESLVWGSEKDYECGYELIKEAVA